MTQRQRKHKLNWRKAVFDMTCNTYKKRNPNGKGFFWKYIP